jgi:hypothetical protein
MKIKKSKKVREALPLGSNPVKVVRKGVSKKAQAANKAGHDLRFQKNSRYIADREE